MFLKYKIRLCNAYDVYVVCLLLEHTDHLIVLILGITNGIDETEWNPSNDENIPSHYSIEDLSGKVVTS